MEKIINVFSILNTPPIRYINFNLLTMFNWKKIFVEKLHHSFNNLEI